MFSFGSKPSKHSVNVLLLNEDDNEWCTAAEGILFIWPFWKSSELAACSGEITSIGHVFIRELTRGLIQTFMSSELSSLPVCFFPFCLFTFFFHHYTLVYSHWSSEPCTNKRLCMKISCMWHLDSDISVNPQQTGLLREDALRWKNVRKCLPQTGNTLKKYACLLYV